MSISLELLSKPFNDTKFDCGNSSINEMLKNSYYEYVNQSKYTYSIIHCGKTVGYCCISFRRLYFPDIERHYIEINLGKNSHYTSLHLDFIAINKNYQKQSFGMQTVYILIQYISNISKQYPIRFMSLDSVIEDELSNKQSFYSKLGFQKVEIKVLEGTECMCLMVRDCHSNINLLDKEYNKEEI